ncbi:MAG TPA: tRNA lysidine(34) synthetase TilS [Candidatus Saccharimonadales bacterium]|nr:tRNA lysidine(34) synthetase TilS [Candidatus Saccharimonadales bacterium]
MDISVQPGHYVLAVSGGVDSMTLLNLLHEQPGVRLTVAHYDHGIRPDSVEDRRLVQTAAAFYGWPFVYAEGRLGPRASEAQARRERYKFLRRVQAASGARAIITAHHQDDALETAILNMLRGTGPRGLSALAERHDLHRPLLKLRKQDILEHAQAHDLVWREDSTNEDERYTRNYVRRQLVPRLDAASRERLLGLIERQHDLQAEIDQIIMSALHTQSRGGQLDRRWFNHLPHNVAREVFAGWLRARGLREFDRRKLERLVIAAKTARAGRRFDVARGWQLQLDKNYLVLAHPGR